MSLNNAIYEVFSEEVVNSEIGSYISYGIRDKTGEYSISDITSDYTKILKIVRLLNEYKVSKIHLVDVIYDFLE
ncbi:MAG: hypothetical protein E7411_02140 [Ruminococcaceae bacterium]|nr:hypothetical protein [Oscillospiraceae bacterium]